MYSWQAIDTEDAEAVRDLRRKYDAGTHEIAQRKEPGGIYVQLIQKRRVKIERKPFFVCERVGVDGQPYTVPMY